MTPGSPPEPPPRPPWRRRVGFYLLLAAAGLIAVHLLEDRPVSLRLAFHLANLELRSGEGRLDRDELIELSVEIRQGERHLARSSLSFPKGQAPPRTTPVALHLPRGEHEAHVRLVFDDQGTPRTFALRRLFTVEEGERPVLIELDAPGTPAP